MSERLTQLLISWRWPLLGMAIVAAAVAYRPAAGVRFDRSLENMFSPVDPLLVPYQQLKRTFGGNEVVMGVYVDPDLLNEDGTGIRRLAAVAQQCQDVEGVRAVLSIDQPVDDNIVNPDYPLTRPTLRLFENYTHSVDGRTAAVVCMLESEAAAQAPRAATIRELRAIIEKLPDGLPPGELAGEPVMIADGFRYLEEDGRRLGIGSTILLSLVILVCFRSLRWLVIPLAVVQLTLVLTKAALVWSGLRLSMVSSMLTAIVTVVGVATVVHVIVRFREARRLGLQPREALVRAGTILAAPIFWACATDAVGFASLLAADVGPVQDFGVMMAVGSLLVVLSVALLLPALVLAGRFDADPQRAWGESRLDQLLAALIRAVQRRPGALAGVALLVSGFASAGVFRLQVETDFTRNFRAGSPVVRSYEFVENNLGGAGVLDVILPAPKRLDWVYLKRVQRMEQRLRSEVVVLDSEGQSVPGLTKVLSLSDAVIAGAVVDLDKMPLQPLRDRLVNAMLTRMETQLPAFYQALYGVDPASGNHYFRIMLRARERQPAEEKLRVIEQVTQIAREELPAAEGRPPVEVTGFYVLLTNLIKSMIRDQWITFGVATVAIFLMMAIAFRSPVHALVAIVPNALPILLVLGCMGWMNVRINMGAAMIAAVSIGLSVDSSIHYVLSFRRACAAGRSVAEALAEVQQTVGAAVVFSTLALLVGFSILATSQFVPTIYFGVLVSLAMLGGLLGNLVLLPLLLRATTREARGR